MDLPTRIARYNKVLRLRAAGQTLEQIGVALATAEKPNGLCRERARQLLRDARNDGKPQPRGNKNQKSKKVKR